MSIREFIKLTRFEHALMLALAVFIAETVVLGMLPPASLVVLVSLLVPIFSEMGSFALNDYLDIEADRLNKPDRPLVRGTISPSFALNFSIGSLLISTIIAWLINPIAFAIALVFNLLAVLYNWKLKDMPIAGNAYIALTMAIPFIFGNFTVSSRLSILALLLAALGFVAGLAREIIKSAQDMEADVKARNSRTLPVIIGKEPAVAIASVLYLLFIPLSVFPFFSGLRPTIVPVIIVGIGDCLILSIVYKVIMEGDFRFARNASLAAFALGMVGLLLAALL